MPNLIYPYIWPLKQHFTIAFRKCLQLQNISYWWTCHFRGSVGRRIFQQPWPFFRSRFNYKLGKVLSDYLSKNIFGRFGDTENVCTRRIDYEINFGFSNSSKQSTDFHLHCNVVSGSDVLFKHSNGGKSPLFLLLKVWGRNQIVLLFSLQEWKYLVVDGETPNLTEGLPVSMDWKPLRLISQVNW